MSDLVDEGAAGRCLACTYPRMGLPAGSACPECGFLGDWEVQRERAEAWYASADGRVPVGVPLGAAALLNSPAVLRIAKRRLVLGFVVPLAVAACLIAILSSTAALVTFERWRELDTQPGVHLDSDCVSVRCSALGWRLLNENVHLPVMDRKGEHFCSRFVSVELFPQVPGSGAGDLGLLSVYLLIVLSGLLAGESIARAAARHARRQMSWAAAEARPTVVMSFFVRPFVGGLICALIGIAVGAAVGLRLAPAESRGVIEPIQLLGIAVFMIWSWIVALRIRLPNPTSRSGIFSAAGWILLPLLTAVVLALLSGVLDLPGCIVRTRDG